MDNMDCPCNYNANIGGQKNATSMSSCKKSSTCLVCTVISNSVREKIVEGCKEEKEGRTKSRLA